jgi:hypothetical protein
MQITTEQLVGTTASAAITVKKKREVFVRATTTPSHSYGV